MLEEGTDLIKDFKNTAKEDRPWAREIIYIVICISICMSTFFVFQAQKSEAIQEKIKAQSELKSLQQLYVSEGKECPKLIQDAVEKRDLYWSAKIDNLQTDYYKLLREDHDKWSGKFEALNRRTEEVKRRTEQLNKKVSQ